MVTLNANTKKDFLNESWMTKLINAGIDINDARYKIIITKNKRKHIAIKNRKTHCQTIPTYTIIDLLNKLPEYIYPVIQGIVCVAELKIVITTEIMCYYEICYISQQDLELNKKKNICNNFIYSIESNLIEALAGLLLKYNKQKTSFKSEEEYREHMTSKYYCDLKKNYAIKTKTKELKDELKAIKEIFNHK